MAAPLIYCWTGEAFEPRPYHTREANRQFVVGQSYKLEVVQDRSQRSHNQLFAALDDAFGNLPERYRTIWATVEHFRKWATVEAGFYNEQIHSTKSHAESVRLAAAIRRHDEFSVCVIVASSVVVRTAKSLTTTGPEAMPAKEFQACKTAVLDIVSDLIGVTPETLLREGQAA